MAERQNRRRKKKDEGQVDKPSEEETVIGKHVRFNLATKTSNFMGHKVDYFTGSKAVDMLLDSKWASGKGNTDILFTDRNSVVMYLDRLLQKGMFHRALKVVKKSKKDEKKDKEGRKEEKVGGDMKKEDSRTKKEKKLEKESKEKPDKENTDKEEGTPKAKKSKEGKRKIKLEPTDDQFFKDGSDAYVWIYDPIKPMYYVYGLLLVVGAIAVCLFPLWPPWMRAGTYYLSLGGAGVVGSVLALAIVRLVVFVLLWGFTLGRFHMWLFPNLLADVGILESFQPAYQLDVNKPDTQSSNNKALTAEEEKTEKEDERRQEEKGPPCDEIQEDDQDDDDNEEEEEDGSHSSSNQDHQEEFEFIEQDEVSAVSEERQPEHISRQ